jgi:hypothetical protein
MAKISVRAALVLLLLAAPQPRRAGERAPSIASVSLPLTFASNHGQFDPAVRFFARSRGCKLFFTDTEAIVQPGRGAPVHIRLAGANLRPRVSGRVEQPGRSNYFVGKDPGRWRTSVRTFGQVAYEGVYPGIDLVYYGNDRRLEFDFVVAPGSDPRSIALEFDGASRVSIGARGDLRIESADAEVSFEKPTVYQDAHTGRRAVTGEYALRGERRVVFDIGDYDRELPLVIDPALLGFSSYLGGAGSESADAITVDALGNIYVSGNTSSADFPTLAVSGAVLNGNGDVFVAKFKPDASALVYSTFLGGSSSETGYGIAVDAAGNAYVAGQTGSDDFPTRNAYQSRFAEGGSDAFLFKLDSTGALIFSTFLGGRASDGCAGLAIDPGANVYLTGETRSTDFPTTAGAFDRTCGTDGTCNPAEFGATYDAYVTKFDSGGKLVYSTYLGGSRDENLGGVGGAIAVDAAGNAYVTGTTYSIDFPTKNPYQAARRGTVDAFVTKLDATGSSLVWSTYLGGKEYESGNCIAVDPGGDVYVGGGTRSADFPFVNAFQSYTGNGYSTAFIARFSADGARLVYSSCLGGKPAFVNGEIARGIALDRDGNAYIAGESTSPDFPGTNAFQPPQGSSNAFVAKICPTGCLVYATTLGGPGQDIAYGIAVDASGNAYVVGETDSEEFPTAYAFQGKHGGAQFDAFMAKLVDSPLQLSPLTLDLGDIALSRQSKAQTITLRNTGTADVKINSIEKKAPGTSSSCGEFTVSNPQLPFTVAAGEKRDISVVFAPARDVDYDCLLQVGVDSPRRALGQVKLTGIGSGLVKVRTEYSSVYQGGRQEFSLTFTNPLSTSLSFDFYLVLIPPNGLAAPMAQTPVSLSGDQVVKIEDLVLPVGSSADTGKYTMAAITTRSDTGILWTSMAQFTVYRLYYPPAKQ